MRICGMLAIALVVSAPSWVTVVVAQNNLAAPSAPPPAINTAVPFAAEQADRLLKQMSDYIGSAGQFTFHADISFDHVLPSGQKLQFSAAEDVALQRPGRLYVEWQGDLGDRQFWYDGKSITLSDPATPFYATEAAPPDIDNMLDGLVPRIRLRPASSRFPVPRPVPERSPKVAIRDLSGPQRCWWQELPHACLRGTRHRLADMDRNGTTADSMQAGDHLQDTARPAAIHRGLH